MAPNEPPQLDLHCLPSSLLILNILYLDLKYFENFVVCFLVVKELIVSLRPPWGWSDGAMVLGKLPVPGLPTNLDNSRARAYCACSGCGWGLFGHFFSRLSFLFSFSLSLGDGPI